MAITFFYDQQFFIESVELVDEAMDATFAIVVFRFPEIRTVVKQEENHLLFESLVSIANY